MKSQEAKELKLKDRVIWNNNKEDAGTVIEIGYCAIKIEWDNGQTGILYPEDMGPVTKQ